VKVALYSLKVPGDRPPAASVRAPIKRRGRPNTPYPPFPPPLSARAAGVDVPLHEGAAAGDLGAG
jgi:hypothetical protein